MNQTIYKTETAVAVIGGGHAGIEAALASARLGVDTVLFTMSLDAIGNMPCNPSIGGTAKGHLVYEIDALGGEMGYAADRVTLQSRTLNLGKGAAVHSKRVQADRMAHVTKRGTSEFGLTNTNKLIRQYTYATGLKTGFTSLAGSCISATAKKEDIELIAVIMKAPNSKTRNAEAISLLNYGFGKCQVYKDEHNTTPEPLVVKKGVADTVSLYYQGIFHYVSVDGSDISAIEKRLELPEEVLSREKAPTRQPCRDQSS